MKKILVIGGIFFLVIVYGDNGMGSKKIKKQRLIIAGIDAGIWKIILPPLRESRLLNFQSLIENSREEEKKNQRKDFFPG